MTQETINEERPLSPSKAARLRDLLEPYFGVQTEHLTIRMEETAERFRARYPDFAKEVRALPHDAVLITYADQLRAPGEKPLSVFSSWASRHLDGLLGHIHFLPFFPSSSDEGFAVMDYRRIDPNFGDWRHVKELSSSFRLMIDAVVNHASAQGDWFHAFLAQDPPYLGYFREISPNDDLSHVVRPRTTPLEKLVETSRGTKTVWTTFSSDQIDLDFSNPDVVVEIFDILLDYTGHGARMIRLDAIGFIWKESGTTCIHLDGAHAIIQAYRLLFDVVAPSVLLVTETNVPHAENISYFGDGRSEAQLVYNFPLPPLLLDAVYRGDASRLAEWADTLEPPGDGCCFFNITATHDGIGVRGAQDVLDADEINRLAEATLQRRGLVSYRHTEQGTMSPYELNITFFDAVRGPQDDPDDAVVIRRYLTVQSVALSLAGVPGIYFHNLLGSLSDHDGLAGKDVTQTEFKRVLNRKRLEVSDVEARLADPESRDARVFAGYARRLKAWRANPAFAPTAPQRILRLDERVLAVLRGDRVFCLHNFSNDAVPISLPTRARLTNLLDGTFVDGGAVQLPPWGMAWLAS